MNLNEFVKYCISYVLCKKNKINFPGTCYLGLNTKIINHGTMLFGRTIIIRPSSHLYTHHRISRINIGEGTELGNHSTIASVNSVNIGNYVLTGPHVYIADHNHEYFDIKTPICKQGEKYQKGDRIEIGDGTWIGTNAVIVGNVHIGKNCVVGANSVVTKDIPDYCVVAGSPARIIKKYNQENQQWEKIV